MTTKKTATLIAATIIMLLSCVSENISAQIIKGIRMPRLTSAQRDEIPVKTLEGGAAGEGQLIFNTDINCQQYWNGKKWVNICLGSANIALAGNGCNYDATYLHSADGETTCTFTPEDDPACKLPSGQSYQVYITAGASYATLTVDELTSEFSLTFSANNSSKQRVAVVHVVNNCSGEFRDFPFWQAGATCPNVANPTVDTLNTTICPGGTTYAYVSNAVAGVDYIWEHSGSIVNIGVSYQINRAGRYQVHAGLLGCGTPDTVTITQADAPQAPAGPRILLSTNDGIICDTEGVTLRVLNVKSGEHITWFHNEVAVAGKKDQNPIMLTQESETGEWYAAITVNGNNCASLPTNKVTINKSSASSPAFTPIQATINGFSFSSTGIVLCANSSVKLEIINKEVYPASRRFYWYYNGELWGESAGEAVYVVPRNQETAVISVKLIVDSDHCPITISTGEVPVNFDDEPLQTTIMWQGEVRNTAYICMDNPAIVSAAIAAKSYQWFKNGSTTPILTKTTASGTSTDSIKYDISDLLTRQSYEISEVGNYTVRYENNSGCWSRISEPIAIARSATANLMWYVSPNDEHINGSSSTWSVRVTPAATNFIWSVKYANNTPVPENKIRIRPMDDGSAAMVEFLFDDSELPVNNVTVSVKSSNDCGEASISKTFNVIRGCTPITTLNLAATANKVKLGEAVRYTATANGSGTIYFQGWVYLDNADISNVPGKSYTWKQRLTSGGEGAQETIGTLSVRIYTADKGFNTAKYVKIRMLDWIEGASIQNQLTVTTFSLGDHYVLVDASNDDGTKTTGCTFRDTPVESELKLLHVDVNPDMANPNPPASVHYVMFNGQKTCFDVHKNGDTGTNSWAGDRLPLDVRPDDFPTATLVNNLYAFTYEWIIGAISQTNGALTPNTAAKTSVIYTYKDNNGMVEKVEKNASGNAVLYFKNTVTTIAANATKNTKKVLTLYAIYTINNVAYKDSVNISVQDAACGCPAKVGSNTWAMFDCHNCGADISKNPKTENGATLRGGYYLWGFGRVAWRDRNQVHHNTSTWNVAYPFDNDYPRTWTVPYSPCPVGWKLGNESTWRAVESYNRWDSNHRSRIIDIGKYLCLPKQGYYHSSSSSIRSDGSYTVAYTSDRYDYWTSTEVGSSTGRNFYGIDINNANMSVDTWGAITKHYAEPCRCVQEGTTYSGNSGANNP